MLSQEKVRIVTSAMEPVIVKPAMEKDILDSYRIWPVDDPFQLRRPIEVGTSHLME